MDAKMPSDERHRRGRRSRVVTSAADLKFLQRLPRVPIRNFKSKAALESWICLCPLLSEVRERGPTMAHELRKAGTRRPLAGVKLATMLCIGPMTVTEKSWTPRARKKP